MRQHPTYQRIHIDGFAEGPVPAEVYADVVGPRGAGFGRAAGFEDSVTALIDRIDSRRSGQIILQHLQNVGGTHGIVIQPASLHNDAIGTWPGRPADAYAQGQGVQSSAARGTGRGTSIKVSFRIDSNASCRFAALADSVLLHELIHAIRSTTGRQVHIPMSSYDRFEEFVAVTVTNVYLSEIGETLRDGHACDRMDPNIVDFRERYRPAFRIMQRDDINAPLFQRLGALPTSVVRWNPFASMMHIDLVDGRPDNPDAFVRGFQRALPDAIRATSLNGGIQSILQRLGSTGRLGRLRILGHGTDGIQGVVQSHRPFMLGGVVIELLENNQISGQSTLQQLTGRFETGGWVELHGCDVAADGGRLIRALAQLWNVAVKASLDTQHVGGGLEGRVHVAWPDGRYERRSARAR